MSLELIDRYHPQKRREKQAHIDMGHLRKIEEVALLDTEQLRPLALLSFIMLIISGIFFVVLDLLAYYGHYQQWIAPLSLGGIFICLILNVIGYILILGIHEIIHGIVFIFWGGKPHFGAKLPLALYCGAQHQLFVRNYYLAVGLAPLVAITLAGIAVTVIYPGVAAYMLLAFAGNFSGAAGDVVASRKVARLPALTLIEDTEVGYIAWEIVSDSSDSSIVATEV